MLNIPEHTWQDNYTFIVHKVRGELLVCLTSHCTAMVWHGLWSHSAEQIAEQMKISQADAAAVWSFMAARFWWY